MNGRGYFGMGSIDSYSSTDLRMTMASQPATLTEKIATITRKVAALFWLLTANTSKKQRRWPF
jgi:hypothetical protein